MVAMNDRIKSWAEKYVPNPSLTGKNIFHKYSGCFV